jgi:hypothetical protein
MFQLNLRALAVAAMLVALTGCLTIEENYSFRKDGSGSMEYVVDMSEVGELMKTLSEMGQTEGVSASSDELGSLDMEDEMAALKGLPGISRVKLDAKKKWVQRLSFRFKDVDALNSALNVLMPDSSGLPHTFFRWEGTTLVRTNNRHAHELGAGMARDEGPQEGEEGADMAAFLEAMKYRYSFKFARDINETVTSARMNKTAAGKREIKFDTDWSVIAEDREALDLRIDLNR